MKTIKFKADHRVANKLYAAGDEDQFTNEVADRLVSKEVGEVVSSRKRYAVAREDAETGETTPEDNSDS